MIRRKELIFIFCGLVIVICFSFLFNPVTNSGDSPDYIRYAYKFLGENVPENFSHRSPLYSLFLAIIIRLFGPDDFPRIVMILQFVLSYLSAITVYFIFIRILKKPAITLIISLLSFFNLSGIYFSYTLLSEILAQFLFVISVYVLILFPGAKKKWQLILLGLLVSLLNLSRFNTIPIIAVFLILILIEGSYFINLKRGIKNSVLFLIGPFIILNCLALINFIYEGSYYVFPDGGSKFVSRNAILASINGNETVSDENKTILEIFLKAKEAVNLEMQEYKKGSLVALDKPGITITLYSGYRIYKAAYNDLCNFYQADPLKAEKILSASLETFYSEIYTQNRSDVFKLRFYSFLNSFRSSSGLTHDANRNLGRLTPWMIILYKISFITVSVFTFTVSILALFMAAMKREFLNHDIVIIILLCYSYYLINFVFGTMGDANRFKFPSDPLMAGLCIYFLNQMLLKYKKLRISGLFSLNI